MSDRKQTRNGQILLHVLPLPHQEGGLLSFWWRVLCKYSIRLQVVPGRARGGSFRRKMNYIAKKEFAYRMCARGPTNGTRCPNRSFAVNEPSAVPWWWWDLFWCQEVVCEVRWSNVVGCEVTWSELLWLVATWRVMSCHVLWCGGHVIWCGVIVCVVSCHARQCDVMWCALMWWAVICCALQWDGMLWAQDAIGCEDTLCGSKWFCDNVVIQSIILYYKELLQYYSSSTLYYKEILQYYSVLQSTTPVLLCTTLYNKVLLQYYSVLQSGTHDWSFSHMNRYFQCAEQQESPSNFTKYCPCKGKSLSWLTLLTN